MCGGYTQVSPHLYYKYFYFQRSLKAHHDLELIKAESNIFNISWRRMKIYENPNKNKQTEEVDYLDGSIVNKEGGNGWFNWIGGSPATTQSEEFGVVDEAADAPFNIPSPTHCCVQLYFDGHYKGLRYPGRPDRQSAVFRWIVMERFCNLNHPLDINHEQFEVLTRTFK